MLQLNTLLSGLEVQDASSEQLVLGITIKVPTSRPAAGPGARPRCTAIATSAYDCCSGSRQTTEVRLSL